MVRTYQSYYSAQLSFYLQPKHFGNYPDRNTRAKTFPTGPSGRASNFKEYPVVSTPGGWHDNGGKGPARVITSSKFEGVITHNGHNGPFVKMT